MPGLFAPIPLGLSGNESWFTLRLDVNEPYLTDHRPGGDPLFSTVMGLEAAVAAARQVASTPAPASLRAVRVLEPYIALGTGPHVVELSIRASSGNPRRCFDCTLFSRQDDGQVSCHLQVQVEFSGAPVDAAATAASMRASPSDGLAPRAVTQRDVYALFFHGPAFQVVASAAVRSGLMQCRFASGLPPSHRHRPSDSEIAPRLLEFALQSAGLLELTDSGRMMIPHSIGRVDRFSSVDVDYSGELVSVARFGSPERSSIDVDILDERGRLMMRVGQYRTEPLPFVGNATAAARLRRLLQNSEFAGEATEPVPRSDYHPPPRS